MRSIFGKLLLAPVVMAAAALATGTAMAETTVKVPFSFSAAGKVWPAGVYSIQKDNIGGTITVNSKVTSESFKFLVGPGEPSPSDSKIVLRFDEVNGAHALRTVQYGPQISGLLDRQPKRDANMAASGR
jgi:hypothetical protein